MEDGRVCERRANVAPPTQHLLSTHEEEEWLVIRPLAPAAELLVASILVDEISDHKISEMGAENWRSAGDYYPSSSLLAEDSQTGFCLIPRLYYCITDDVFK